MSNSLPQLFSNPNAPVIEQLRGALTILENSKGIVHTIKIPTMLLKGVVEQLEERNFTGTYADITADEKEKLEAFVELMQLRFDFEDNDLWWTKIF